MEKAVRQFSTLLHTGVARPITILGIVLIAATACKLDRAQKRAPGQPAMSELMHRRADQNQAWEKQRQALVDEVHRLTPQQAQVLEAQVKTRPQDRETLTKLVRYYQYKVDVKRMNALTLWHIEHEPNLQWPWNINPAWDQRAYELGKKLWLRELKRSAPKPAVYRNAAAYLEGGDKPLAEDILLAGQKKYPTENWAMALGQHYAQAVLGSTGPLAEFNVVRSVSMKEAHGPYAQNVRNKLAASNDPRLLTQSAQWLMVWGRRLLYSKEKPLDFDCLAIARSYNDRALSVEPDYRVALSMETAIEEARTAERIRNAPVESLNASDRLKMLTYQMEEVFLSGKMDQAKSKALELLAATQKNVSDPACGNAILLANLRLGEMALQRGAKRQSVRYLLAASQAPITDRLRYWEIDMSLARKLVDWGEREPVAQFLEHCSKFNYQGKVLAEWASQIRKGINPDLIPYRS